MYIYIYLYIYIYWTYIWDIWTCIRLSGLVFWGSTHHPVVHVLAAGAFFSKSGFLFSEFQK